MQIKKKDVKFGQIPKPALTEAGKPIDLTDITMKEHYEKIMNRMIEENLDFLFIYADREHGGNFGYLTGFEPRFEEAALVLHKDGTAYLMLGNESVKMGRYARIAAEVIQVPYFSLPNQPMEGGRGLKKLIEDAGIKEGMHGGLAGWKMFTSPFEENDYLFETPYFLVNTVLEILGGAGSVKNMTRLFIHPQNGARTCVNANEIAHYEYGASKASGCIYRLMEELEPGKSELELAGNLAADGQPHTTQAICAAGERFKNAVVAPRSNNVKCSDRFSMSMGLRGGLTCRTGYVAQGEQDLPIGEEAYLEQVVKPYYAALATWYSSIRIGMEAGLIYDLIEEVIPRDIYGWTLNPGHLTASEEWMSSPFYENSKVILESGMMFQMDIILSVPGYAGSNAEDGIVLADKELREQLKAQYPQMWDRLQNRRRYMKDVIGIEIAEEVLPMSTLNGYLRPYLLAKEKAMYIQSK